MAYWKKIPRTACWPVGCFYVLFQIGYSPTSAPLLRRAVKTDALFHRGNRPFTSRSIVFLSSANANWKIPFKARGMSQSSRFYQRYTILTSAMVFEQQCVQCHLGDDKRYPDTVRMKNTPLVNHYETIKNGQSCLTCHRDIGHAVDIHLTVDLKNTREIK